MTALATPGTPGDPGVLLVSEGANALAGPPAIPDDMYRRRWAILAVLSISLVTIVTAVSSLNVALPRIQESLNTTSTELQWILDSYALVFAGLLLPAGALGDRFGRKGALQIGLVIFGITAFLAAHAETAIQLIGLRALGGIGAALIMPATLSIIVNSFPANERPKAIAIWAAFAGVGGALGPITSGLVLEHSAGFGMVFIVNIPLIVVLLALSTIVLPKSSDPGHTALDPIGAALSVVGLVALIFAVIEGPERGWTDPLTIGGYVLAIVGLTLFVLYELRTSNPMLDPRLFKLRGFSVGAAAITVAFFAMFGMFFLLTQYLQFVQGYSPLEAGIRTLPSAAMLMFWAPRSPKLTGRFGAPMVVRVGFISAAIGFTLLAFARPDTSYWLVAMALMFTGTGIALVMPPASQQVVSSLPLTKAGVGSAVNDVTREVGGALGIAVAGSIVSTIYRSGNDFADRIADPTARELAAESVGRASVVASRGLRTGQIDQSTYDSVMNSAGDAFNNGTVWAFGLMATVCIVAAVVLGQLMPTSPNTRVGEGS
jgi:EmrB/QacA subfamily drug resistance transporter